MSNFRELVRIGKDAVTRYTQGGKAVTGFSAAFDNGWGDHKQTVWLDCSIWGERGEKLAQYLTKGSLVLVEGDIGTREHDGKTYLTLDVREVKLTGKPDSGNGTPRRTAPQGKPAPVDDFDDETIPF